MVKKKGGLTFTLHLPPPNARYDMEDQTTLKNLLSHNHQPPCKPEGYSWLQQKAKGLLQLKVGSAAVLNAAFATVPRKMGNQKITLNEKERESLQTAKPTL